jgi:ParB family transcriptional regulator, chromosome partitioning protein
MKAIDVPIIQIHAAAWNPNVMDETMRIRLRRSIERFGLMLPLVVRPIGDDSYQTIGGAQRLAVLKELGVDPAPCVVVEADDAHARLLTQALNRIQGQDDLGLRAELLKELLEHIPEAEVLKLLPDTAQGLNAFASLGQQDMASYLQNWRQVQGARLKHLTFQSTPAQLEVIEEAPARVMPQARDSQGENPNRRGRALFLLCKSYLELTGRDS